MNAHELFMRSFIGIIEQIVLLQNDDRVDECTANAWIVINHINASMEFYESNRNLIPEHEFELLLKSIDKLFSIDIDSRTISHYVFIEMVNSVIWLHDLLHDRKPDDERLKNLHKVMNKFSGSSYKVIHAPSSSFTATYIRETLAKQIYLIDAKSMECKNISLEKTLIDYSGKRIPVWELERRIRNFFYSSEGKESFVKRVLKNYQESYRHTLSLGNTSAHMNRLEALLIGVERIFPLFDILLPPKRFVQLLDEMDFYLKRPTHPILEGYWYHYKFYISLHTGKPENNIFPDADRLCWQYITHKPGILCKILQVQGRNAFSDIRVCDSNFGFMSLFTQKVLFMQTGKYEQIFNDFIQRFDKVNRNASQHQQRNITFHFTKYHSVISQIINIMGEEGIRYMQNFLAGTVLHLERTLESIPVLPDALQQFFASYFQQCGISVRKNSNQVTNFISCIIATGTLLSVSKGNSDVQMELSQYVNSQAYQENPRKKTPEDLLMSVVKILTKTLLDEQVADLNQKELANIFDRLDPVRFTRLAAASRRMNGDIYREIYLRLLRRDLIGESIYSFLHNTEQGDTLGRSLAKHNQNIRNQLTANGISPETALEYTGQYDFIVQPEGDANLNDGNAQVVLWTYFKQLKSKAAADLNGGKISDKKNKNRMHAIVRRIGELQKLLPEENSASKQDIANKMAQKNAQSLIEKIVNNIEALLNDSHETSTGFKEFAEHTIEQCKHIKKSRQRTNLKNKIKIFYFSVEQWNKEKLTTFFLGDEVGCCLGTTNGMFPAMVQRRMDDALLFHVAVDKENNRPAALIWLYLAETKDGKIVLVANFFEVNVKYAMSVKVRRGLLNGLLQFTRKYLQDNPQIAAFYMNPLTYGWNVGDLNSHPFVDVELSDKLGGPYIPPDSYAQIMDTGREKAALTCKKYYLVSLERKKFHRLEPQKLDEESQSTLLEKDKILQEAIRVLSEKGICLEALKKAVIDNYSLQLERFYDVSMEKDQCFAADLSQALECVVSEKAEDYVAPAHKSQGLGNGVTPSRISFFPSQSFGGEDDNNFSKGNDLSCTYS